MSTPNTYDIDTLITIRSNFTEIDGTTPIDPTTVTLYVLDSCNVETTFTGGALTRVSTGVYTYNLLLNRGGVWLYKWQGAGAVEITSPDTLILVNASALISS